MKNNIQDKIFDIFNYAFLISLALLCVLPFIHILAISFSSGPAATAGKVTLWPVEFNTNSYIYAFSKPEFIRAFFNSVKRVLLGVTVNMALLSITAYPLSKPVGTFFGRTFFSWFFVVTMLVSGGLIPTYLVVNWTGIRDTIWSLILPTAVNAFHLTILLNFYRQIPRELEESAFLDGAGQWTILFRLYIPLSIPALATLTIFNTVAHWNEWFHGIIYLDSMKKYPLQSYLRNVIIDVSFDTIDVNMMDILAEVTSRTFRAAQVVIATVPIICIYPFLQRYFVKGMTLGSLKG